MRLKPELAIMIIFVGCSTVPGGTSPTKRLINKTSVQTKESMPPLSGNDIGRVRFIKVKKYPQTLPSGDILLNGETLVKIGREKVDIDQIIKDDK